MHAACHDSAMSMPHARASEATFHMHLWAMYPPVLAARHPRGGGTTEVLCLKIRVNIARRFGAVKLVRAWQAEVSDGS